MPTPSTAASASSHVRVDGISKSFSDRRVLTDITFTVPAGVRLGLIGENGSGKSTLLRIIAGHTTPDGGTVQVSAPSHTGSAVGLLHQEPPFSAEATVEEALEQAVAPVRAAVAELDAAAEAMAARPDDAGAADAYTAALERAEAAQVWDVDSRIATTLAGLGIDHLPRERRTGHLSGGQRSRLALAWLLLSAPDVLLLDEPTNHLDDAAAEHLRGALQDWAGPVLIASHDRAFLDETVTALVDLDPSPIPHAVGSPLIGDGTGTGIGVTRFTGTYTDYLQVRREERARWERRYADEQAELKRLAAAVRDCHTVGNADRAPRTEARAAKKFYADRNAKVVSRRVNDARSKYDDLRERQIRKPPQDVTFRGLTVARPTLQARASGAVLTATGVAVEGRLAPTSLAVGAQEKWLVVGPNGSGKSTLLSILAGALTPGCGSVATFGGARVGLLAQDAVLPDPHDRGPGRTAVQAYEDVVGSERAETVPLGTFGLVAGRDENRPVATLSVGQQRRLALAAVLADPPEVLLLDEPTNHLSLPLVTDLEAAIPDYPGAVVVASHDRWLRQRWTGRVIHLDGVG